MVEIKTMVAVIAGLMATVTIAINSDIESRTVTKGNAMRANRQMS